MKKLMTGDEGVARGAYEAGIAFAAAYPGTPSTEILENIALYKEIKAEWSPNEKVAVESAIGASLAGARSLTAMKMVGVNVAADPLLSYAYAGVNGGLVLISADDPGMHSSQNEQDNRNYAKFAKIPMLEPSDSQEAKDMVKTAFDISETYDTPVMLRMTTRVCHSKSLVEEGSVLEQQKKQYVKNLQKNDLVPAVSKQLRIKMEERLTKLKQYTEETSLNFEVWNSNKIGVITAGVSYQYAQEVFGENASYLKIGMAYPLPIEKIRRFAEKVETLYIIEELDPFMEEQIRAAGITKGIGKSKIPVVDELNPDILAKVLLKKENKLIAYDKEIVVNRPPTLCAGCPHRGFFYALAKCKDIVISGDIGCYGLGGSAPLHAKDTCICMGAAPSIGHGMQKMFNKFGEKKRVVAVLGDSTFFHTGMNSLLTTVYNNSNTITCILDNRITGMTGHQENPGTGFTLQGDPTEIIDIAEVVKSFGIKNSRTVNPLKLNEVKDVLDWAMACEEPVVIITRWPCILKRLSKEDVEEFGSKKAVCEVDPELCIGCKKCLQTGCPALQYQKDSKKVMIDQNQCNGCEVCNQVCPKEAIKRVGE